MARIVFADRATADAIGIYTDLNAKAGLQTVEKFSDLFRKLYDRLADQPDSGAPRPALGQNVRTGIVLPYIAFIGTKRPKESSTYCALCTAVAESPLK